MLAYQKNGSQINRQHDDWDEVHNQLLSIQKKSLEISTPGNADEKEADAVARKVVDGQSAEIHETGSSINRKGEGSLETTPAFQSQLQNNIGGGQSLDDSTRSEMESKMGADFSGVKIHTGSEAHNMSENINAKAFTHGQDVFFKQGQYDTNSLQGKELLAHELTHTVQQKKNNLIQRKINIQSEEDPKEEIQTKGHKKKKKKKESSQITYTAGMTVNDTMNDFTKTTINALNMINAGDLGAGQEFIPNLTDAGSEGFIVRIVPTSFYNPDATKFGEPNLGIDIGGTLNFNPNMGYILTDPYVENAGTENEAKNYNMSPVRALMHELDHANQLNFIRPISANLLNDALTDKMTGLKENQKTYLQGLIDKYVNKYKWEVNNDLWHEISHEIIELYNRDKPGNIPDEARVMEGSETVSGKKMKEGTRTDYEIGITGVYKSKAYNSSEAGVATTEEQKLIDEENIRIKDINADVLKSRGK